MTIEEIIEELKKHARPDALKGMARVGINTENMLGIKIPDLRKLAKRIGRDHSIALGLWKTGIQDARILAGMVDEHEKVNESQMEKWVKDFNSWDLCDQVCMNLFDRTPYVFTKIDEWSRRDEEFVKRAAFALMASLAVHDKKGSDSVFKSFLSIIKREATDERNYVKKAVNWALRQIGKRNKALNRAAINVGEQVQKIDSKAARWIAADALRELRSEKVQERLRK
jgi:3-methyladenine DNA glycosylase AlkD